MGAEKARVAGRTRSWQAVAVSIVCATALGACATTSVTRPAAHPTGRPTSATLVLDDRLRLDSSPNELVFDRERDALWFADFDSTVPGDLVRYDIRSGVVRRYRLDRDPGPGVYTRLRIAPDGSVWLARDYRIDRLDPRTGRVRSITVPAGGPGAPAQPGGDPVGTWITALTFDGTGHAVVARAGVASLQVYDPAMTPRPAIAIPADLAGAADIVVAGNGLHLAGAPGAGRAERVIPAPGLWPPPEPEPSRTTGTPAAAVTVAYPGGDVLVYDAITGTLRWQHPGRAADTITLPTTLVDRRAPSGLMVKVPAHDEVLAMTLDASSTLWFVRAGYAGIILTSARPS